MSPESAAEFYIQEHRLDGMSLKREHLQTLAVDMRLTIEQIASLLNCHEELILRKAIRWKLPIPSRTVKATHEKPSSPQTGIDVSNRRQRRYSNAFELAREYVEQHGLDKRDPSTEELDYLYVKLGLPKAYLNRLFGQRLGFLLERAGISRRDGVEQKLLGYKADFFEEWTPASAWVLGLLYTDGNISRNSVSLSSVDSELLEQVRDLIAPHLQIQTSAQSYDKSRKISRLTVKHPKIVAGLRMIGLTERKSLVMTFPDVPHTHVRHFIRGCWDGDGGFSLAGGTFAAHYTCGSVAFIGHLSSELFRIGIGRRQLARADAAERAALQSAYGPGPYSLRIYKRASSNAYDLRFGAPEHLKTFYYFLYDDVPWSLCLARKRKLLEVYMVKNGWLNAEGSNQGLQGTLGSVASSRP